MQTPIIANNRGDVSVFATAGDATSYAEPIDIRNGEYEVYDASGRHLAFQVIGNRATLISLEDQPTKQAVLAELLRKHISHIPGHADVSAMTLGELIAERMRFKLD
jgi:hypothetical protein